MRHPHGSYRFNLSRALIVIGTLLPACSDSSSSAVGPNSGTPDGASDAAQDSDLSSTSPADSSGSTGSSRDISGSASGGQPAGGSPNSAGTAGAMNSGGGGSESAISTTGFAPGQCDASMFFVRGGNLEVGTFCDDVFVCATPTQMEVLGLAAPDYNCDPGQTGLVCETGEVCLWQSPREGGGPGVLNADSFDSICTASSLDNPVLWLECRVWE